MHLSCSRKKRGLAPSRGRFFFNFFFKIWFSPYGSYEQNLMKILGAVFENHAFNHFDARNNRLGNTLLLFFYISHKLELIIYSKEKSVWRYLSPIFCNLFSKMFKSKKNSTQMSFQTNKIIFFHYKKFF